MADSTGIILAAGGITAGNEWLHHGTAGTVFRIGIATAGAAVILAGIEHIPDGGREAAVGIAVIALIGTLLGGLTPGVPSPAAQILDFVNKRPPASGKKK